MAIGGFRGDGKADLVAAVQNVHVLVGHGHGGGLINKAGTVAVQDCAFPGNLALGGDRDGGAGGGDGLGGGAYNAATSSLRLERSTAKAMMISLAHNLANKTYFMGLSDFIDAVGQPDQHAERWLKSRAGSYVPAVVAKANDDDALREARTMMDAVLRRIPGYGENLPPRRNFLGEVVTPPAGWLPFGAEGTSAARQLSPVGYSKTVGDPVKRELAKLHFGFGNPPKTYRGFDLQTFANKEGRDAHDRWHELHGEVKIGGKTLGEALTKLIASKRYQSIPEPERSGDKENGRVQLVQKVLADYRERAFRQVKREFPQIGRALKIQDEQDRIARREQRNAQQILSGL